MNAAHDVISDFLDGEAFDPVALGESLADPAGRDLLIDFVILRYAARAEAPVAEDHRPRRSSHRRLAAVAAGILALAGAYLLGQRHDRQLDSRPPEPTSVIEAARWQPVAPENNQ